MAEIKKVDWRVILAAIIALMILEIVALCNHINGTLFTMVCALIAGLAGWTAPQLRLKK